MDDEQNRREFIGNFFRLGGLFLPFAAWKGWAASTPGQAIPETAPVQKRLLTIEPKELIEGFARASGGSLVYHYQMYFPTFLSGNEMEKVLELKRLCWEESAEGVAIEKARKHAIPAIAAAHALSTANEDEAQFLRDIFTETFKTAITGSEFKRMGLGVIWSCMTSATIRNRYNWQKLTVGPEIIHAATVTCLEFIGGKDSGLLLLHAATAAWQFLLTYQSALLERTNPNVGRELAATTQAIQSIQNMGGERFKWLDKMEQVIGVKKSYENVTPSYMEMLLGRSHFRENSPERKVADHAALIRLQIIYQYHLVETGQLKPEYFPGPDVANDMGKRNLAFLACFGVRPQDWPAIKNQGQGLLTLDSERYLDDLFSNFESSLGDAKISKEEEHYAQWYSKHVPFRHALPEESAAANAYSDKRSLEIASENVRSGVNDPLARLEFSLPALVAGIALEKPGLIDKTTRRNMLNVVSKSALDILSSEKYEHAYRQLSERLPEFLSRLAGPKISVLAAIPPVSSLVTAKPTIDVSARINLAEQGAIQSPETEERREMKMPDSSESKKAPKILAIPSVIASAPLMAMLSSKSKKIRFPDNKTASRGFMLLLRSGHGVDAFGDNTFGITSDEQLQLLTKNDVPYESVD